MVYRAYSFLADKLNLDVLEDVKIFHHKNGKIYLRGFSRIYIYKNRVKGVRFFRLVINLTPISKLELKGDGIF